MAITLLSRFSYPKQPGDAPWSIVDVTGPASYVQVTPGDPGPPPTPPTGGQRVMPQDFGLVSIDIVVAMASTDAKYAVAVIPSPPFELDDVLNSVLLQWTDLSTGVQATAGEDLSQSTVRLLAIGH